MLTAGPATPILPDALQASPVQPAQPAPVASTPGVAPGTPGAAPGTPPGVAPQPAMPDTERVKAQKGVGLAGRSLDPYEGAIVTPAKTLFTVRERVVFEAQIPEALKLYKALNGKSPASHDEFIKQIIEANQIQLPGLPPGQPERHILAVVIDDRAARQHIGHSAGPVGVSGVQQLRALRFADHGSAIEVDRSVLLRARIQIEVLQPERAAGVDVDDGVRSRRSVRDGGEAARLPGVAGRVRARVQRRRRHRLPPHGSRRALADRW